MVGLVLIAGMDVIALKDERKDRGTIMIPTTANRALCKIAQ
jgi:hypothetical protein